MSIATRSFLPTGTWSVDPAHSSARRGGRARADGRRPAARRQPRRRDGDVHRPEGVHGVHRGNRAATGHPPAECVLRRDDRRGLRARRHPGRLPGRRSPGGLRRADRAGRSRRPRSGGGPEMLEVRLPRFNSWLADQGLGEPFEMGIGLNSGPFMSGNVGSARALEYTVHGDTVNTASRLEAMTKRAGRSSWRNRPTGPSHAHRTTSTSWASSRSAGGGPRSACGHSKGWRLDCAAAPN